MGMGSRRGGVAKRRGMKGVRAVAEGLESRVLLDGVNFAPPLDYATGWGPYSVTAADFNGDGKPDLAVANNHVNTVSVLLNNGNGTFAAHVDYATGSRPYSVTAADFNGDDKPDLAVANYYSNTVSVLLNNGDGTFAAKVDCDTGRQPYSVTSADFNGDGKADLAVANERGNTMSVLLNNGDGTFAARVYDTGSRPQSITSADFNGDKKPDLAVANYSSSTVSVLLNNGNGTFATKVDYDTGPNPQSVTSADVNGDGNVDLAVCTSYSPDINTVMVLLNSGDGRFFYRAEFPTGRGSYSVTAADFNGDGKIDLGVGNSAASAGNTVGVLLNSGNGVFAAKVDYATRSGSYSVTAADFNGDDKPDLAVTNYYSNTVSVLLSCPNRDPIDISLTNSSMPDRQSSGTPVGRFSTSDPDAAVLFTYTLVSGTGSDDNGSFMLTGSYLKTAAVFDYGTKKVYSIRVRSTDAGGLYLEKVFTINVVSATFMSKLDYATGISPYSVTAADFNGDKKPDLAVANYNSNTVSVLLNNGNGTFAAKADYATGIYPAYPYSVTSADFNGDGKPDLAVANSYKDTVSVLLNNGNGTFATKVDYDTGNGPYSVTAADFNGDGKADLAVANHNSDTVSVLLNNGNGTFADKVDCATGSQPYSVSSADFNGDGKPDLAVANHNSDTVSVLFNNGNGTFAAKDDYATESFPESVTAADFNGDGKADLAVGNIYNNAVSVLLNNGNGTFAARVNYGPGSSSSSVTSADFNGDGKIDLAVANSYNNTVIVLMNNGNGTFAANADYATGSYPESVTAADFNGDGKADLAVANSSSSTVSVLMNATAAAPLVVNSAGSAYMKLVGAYIGVWNNADGSGTPVLTRSLAMTSMVSVTGASGGGSISLDFSGGSFVPEGGLTIDTNGGGQVLNVIGSSPFGLSIAGGGVVGLGAVEDKALVVSGLSIEAGGTLDLADNDMIIPASAATRAAVYANVFNAIKRGRAGGTWAGKGLTSTTAKNQDPLKKYAGLASMINDRGSGEGAWYIKFDGIAVTKDDILVKYSWNGDANLDGIANIDDYFRIDAGFITQVGGFQNGDFNYDGVVNADDYFLIDSAYIGQSGVLAEGEVRDGAALARAEAHSTDGADTGVVVMRAGEGVKAVFGTRMVEGILGMEEDVLA